MPNGYEQKQSDKRVKEIKEAKMTGLKKFSTEQLQAEVERRETPQPILPSPLVHPDFDILRKEVVDYLNFLRSEKYDKETEDKYATDIFEEAINSFYDKSIWSSYIIPMMKWQADNKEEDTG
jgi:hypothetical protein